MIDEITRLRAKDAGLPAAESHPDRPLHSHPLRVDWENAQPPVPESHAWPAPEKVSTPVTEYGGKAPVADLVDRVRARGWTVLVTEARGCLPSVGQRPSRQRTSYAVRMAQGTRRAVAVYTEPSGESGTWAWDSLWWWDGVLTRMHREETITALVDSILGPVHGPTLADAGLGPIHGPKVMPRGFLAKMGPVHGPELPPGFQRIS